jgi:hypothetical protein
MPSYLALLTPPRFHGMKGPRLHTFQSRVSIVGTPLSPRGRAGSLGAVWRRQDTEAGIVSVRGSQYSKLVVPFGLRDGFNINSYSIDGSQFAFVPSPSLSS